MRAAKAAAALEGRGDVSPEDVQKAIKLVIIPRADLEAMNNQVRPGPSILTKRRLTHLQCSGHREDV